MKFYSSPLEDCYIVETQRYDDNRGSFQELFQNEKYNFLPKDTKFVQDNLSISNKNVLRGIHFQIKFPQAKLVQVLEGSVFDAVVDLRPQSKNFGKYFSIVLSKDNGKQIWIPEGFGHGFLSLAENTIFYYKCTDYYNPNDEGCILWNDLRINIDWPKADYIISNKDLLGNSFDNYCKSLK